MRFIDHNSTSQVHNTFSETQGRYFGDLTIDGALHKWLKIDLWYTHQGVERDMFYHLIKTYLKQRKHPNFAEFWNKVEQAVTEHYPDSTFDSTFRIGALHRLETEATIIFQYEGI